jgi:SAM-dependent methyltransferase
MNTYSDPAAYWESRLSRHFDLTGVGYAVLGPHYNARMYQARLQALDRALVATSRTLTNARFLEIGCGIGFYTDYASRHGITDYVGLDITSKAISVLQERYPQFHFYQSDIADPEIELDAEFDIVLAADVLFHIIDDDAFRVALHNITSRLKSNGLLIVSDTFPRRTLQSSPHVRNRSLDDYLTAFHFGRVRLLHMEPIFAILQPLPVMPEVARSWRLYSQVWRYVLHFARWVPVDRVLPNLLGWLDRRFFLPRYGLTAPNSKWMLAVKDAA